MPDRGSKPVPIRSGQFSHALILRIDYHVLSGLAALTIASTPARIVGGSVGHAATNATNVGSSMFAAGFDAARLAHPTCFPMKTSLVRVLHGELQGPGRTARARLVYGAGECRADCTATQPAISRRFCGVCEQHGLWCALWFASRVDGSIHKPRGTTARLAALSVFEREPTRRLTGGLWIGW